MPSGDRSRWFSRNRGSEFSDSLWESTGEDVADDQWLGNLSHEEQEDGPGPQGEGSGEDTHSPNHQRADLLVAAVAALEKLDDHLKALDEAVRQSAAELRDSRYILERIQSEADAVRLIRPAAGNPEAPVKKPERPSAWVEARRRRAGGGEQPEAEPPTSLA